MKTLLITFALVTLQPAIATPSDNSLLKHSELLAKTAAQLQGDARRAMGKKPNSFQLNAYEFFIRFNMACREMHHVAQLGPHAYKELAIQRLRAVKYNYDWARSSLFDLVQFPKLPSDFPKLEEGLKRSKRLIHALRHDIKKLPYS